MPSAGIGRGRRLRANQLVPAAVVVVDTAVRPGRPDDLRHRIGDVPERFDRLVLASARFAQLVLCPLPLRHVAADCRVARRVAVRITKQDDAAHHPHRIAGLLMSDPDVPFGVALAQRARKEFALDDRAIVPVEEVEERDAADRRRVHSGDPRRSRVQVDGTKLQVRDADEVAGVLDEEGKVLQARFRLPHGRDVDEGRDPANHSAFRVALGDVRALHALVPGRGERVRHLVLDPLSRQHAGDVRLDLLRDLRAEELVDSAPDHLRRRHAEAIGVRLVHELETTVGPDVGQDDRARDRPRAGAARAAAPRPTAQPHDLPAPSAASRVGRVHAPPPAGATRSSR